MPAVITAIVQCALLMSASFAKGTGEPDAHARVELHPPDAPEVIGHDVPRGRPIGLAEAGPARRLVAPGRLEGAPGDTDVEDALAHALRRIDRVGEPTQPDHVPALAIVRIGVEQVVGNVLHDLVDLAPGHLPHPRVRVGHGGVRVHILERDLLARHDRDPPPKTGPGRDLRVAAPEFATSVRPTRTGCGSASWVWPPRTTSSPWIRDASFRSTATPLCERSTTRSTFLSSRSSSTSVWTPSSRIPKVRSGTKRRGWETGV